MRFMWFLRNKAGRIESVTPASAPIPSVPQNIAEDAAGTIIGERKLHHWLDEAYRQCEQSGGFEHLQGKGKPLEVPIGDPLNGLLKNANVLPPWLELQHEIRDQIRNLIRKLDNALPADARSEIDAINKKIARYNNLVPTPILQKGKLSLETIAEQYERWE